MTIKLYMHPVSTTSRPVRLFLAEKNIPVTEQLVDITTGEHLKEAYAAINPSRQVPTLEDGDFRLTESSAILKYLASKFEASEYPRDLKKRARVDEAMDWFNTQFNRDFSYGLLYPQIFSSHKRPTEDHHKGTIAWGKERAKNWLNVLDKHFLDRNDWVANNQISIADYFGGCLVTAGEVISFPFEGYPNVERWIGNLKKLSSWSKINEVLYGFAGSLKGKAFETL
jgi:glutathione S-transferase